MKIYLKSSLLLFGILLVGCTLSSSAMSENISIPPTEPDRATAVLEEAAATLPATITPEPSHTPLPIIPDKAEDSHSNPVSEARPVPTATFAAYGVTQTIGYSVQGRAITSYRFGFGHQTIVLVGGIHGGYEWNTIVLAYEMIDYFLENPGRIPANISLYIIPSANPDGQFAVTGLDGRFSAQDVANETEPGRFNANQVDLNRNWACDWQQQAVWGDTIVSGGTVPFSEPETAALRSFFMREKPVLVLFWHSKADGLYVGSCQTLYEPSQEAAEVYSLAADYRVHDRFTAYPITGDASDWLATQDIPSFTVELKTHSQTDWPQNLAGVLALLDHYGR